MKRFKKVMRVAGWLGFALVAVGLLAAFNLGSLVTFAMTPGVAFEAEAPPPAPDHASPGNWSALPERDDSADRAPTGAAAVDQLRVGVDVFCPLSARVLSSLPRSSTAALRASGTVSARRGHPTDACSCCRAWSVARYAGSLLARS